MIHPPQRPSPDNRACREQCISAFEQAWARGERPVIAAYLPPGEVDRHAVLVELVHTDLEFRLKAGEPARVEDYLPRHPEIAREPSVLLELLASEYQQRRRRELSLETDEYAQRFPGLPGLVPRLRQTLSTRDPHATKGAESGELQVKPSPDEGPWPGLATTTPAIATAPIQNGLSVPGYEILEQLGRGGMGVVYKARHLKLGRVVALKMVLTGVYASEAERALFRQEAEASARLNHPHIVQIYEVGEHQGLPYLCLEFVEGASLAEQLKGTPLPPQQAARLIETLARAIHVAHLVHIVHRDLKPGNVLLAKDGTPKVTDFGLAKLLDAAGQSINGVVMGTPSYMAPEQALGKVHEVGPAADIHALGAILYELITGLLPFRGETPQKILEQVVSYDPIPPRRLFPKTPVDLETICLQCLHKDPARRYLSALELAADLRRFLVGLPTRARPVGWSEHVRKWARRRPAIAALLAALILATASGFVAVTWQWRRAETEAIAKGKALEGEGQALVREREQRKKADQQWYFLRVRLAADDLSLGRPNWAADRLSECPSEFREWEWHYLTRRCGGHPTDPVWSGLASTVSSVAFLPGRNTLVSAGGNGAVSLRDIETGKVLRTLKGHQKSVWWVACEPNGRRLATAGEDGVVIVWDAESGTEKLTYRAHQGIVSCVLFQPKGEMIASATIDPSNPFKPGTIHIWDGSTGMTRWTLHGHTHGVTGLAFSPDGCILASTSYDRTVRLWDSRTGKLKEVFEEHTLPVAAVAFSPDGKWLASTGGPRDARQPKEGEVLLWELETKTVVRLRGHYGRTVAVAFHPNGKRLATAGWDNMVRLWSVAEAQEVLTLKGHEDTVTSIAFSPDGSRLASGAADRTVRVWDAR